LRHKCPEISGFLDEIMPLAARDPTPAQTREAEQHVLKALNGWLVYVIDPAIYDRQPFTGWDSNELLSLTDWRDKVVVDIGAGTGRLSFTVAEQARVVYAVEPVANLRAYMLSKAAKLGIVNFYAVDGLIERIPFADGFSDITMEGHTFPDDAEGHAAATSETERVTKRGGMVIHCPGNNDADNATHAWLTSHSYHWSRFEEPRDGWKRKYWKTV
jgi:SAM-dependent methyltransferase